MQYNSVTSLCHSTDKPCHNCQNISPLPQWMIKLDRLKEKKKSGKGRGVSTELNEGMFEWFNFLNFLELFPFLPETGFVLLYWFFGKLCNECHIYYKRCVGSFTNRYKVLDNSVLFCLAVLNVLACFTALCSELHTSSWRNIRLMNCAILFSFSP